MSIRFSYKSIIICGSLIAGIIFYALRNELIMFKIMPEYSSASLPSAVTMQKKIVKLIFWYLNSWRTENVELIWSNIDNTQNIFYLVNRWLTLLDEEKIMDKKVTLQSVVLSPSGKELFLSFDRNPLKYEDSTYLKLMWCEGLLKTLRDNGVNLQSVRFLVHHTLLEDEHLDFLFSWPISGFLSATVSANQIGLMQESLTEKTHRPFTVMIDPAGDAKHAGRMLEDNFERGITLSCANCLKHDLETKYKNVRVILSRFAGETLEPMQNANFSNRLQVDFYISIHFYHDTESNPTILLYRYAKHPTDDWPRAYVPLSLIPYDQVHLVQNRLTSNWCLILQDEIKKRIGADIKNLAIPFLSLKGIFAPAIAIEIGLKSKNDWQHYIPSLVGAVGEIIKDASL